MTFKSLLFTTFTCVTSTLVMVWLLGSLVSFVMDEAGPAGREVLAQVYAPWFSQDRHEEVRRIEPITVTGRLAHEPKLAKASAPH